MVVSFEKIVALSSDKVTFFTARFGEDSDTEFEKFVANDFSKHQNEITILFSAIKEMAGRGAKYYYFKDERHAYALPKVPGHVMAANKKDYGVRLYCAVISETEVILLNGGIKTSKNPEACPNVRRHFKVANSIARALKKVLEDNDEKIVDIKIEI